jgi:U3 small nucleolar RNA-associated protein 3
MGKGRSRNTVKTGDKAQYRQKSRQDQSISRHASRRGGNDADGVGDEDDDAMFDQVDRHHLRREKLQQEEFLRFGTNAGEDSADEGEAVEAVMDLGVGGSDDDGDDDDESSSDEEGSGTASGASSSGLRSGGLSSGDEEETDGDDDNASHEDLEGLDDVRDWGKRKSSYYHGDTADLEIGQEQEDAFLEEQAAKEIQKARMQDLSEEDFAFDDDVADVDARNGDRKIEGSNVLLANVNKLTRKEKRKLLDRQSPEFMPLVSHFADVVRELQERTNVATGVLLEGEAGAAEVSYSRESGQAKGPGFISWLQHPMIDWSRNN